jgi:hypothetical protein
MCEIVRTLITKGIIRDKDNNVVKLDELKTKIEVLDSIECAKFSENTPGICAVSGSSYFEKDGWTILFGGDSVGVSDGISVLPKWRKKNMSEAKIGREKVNDDRISPVEEFAKDKAKKELENLLKPKLKDTVKVNGGSSGNKKPDESSKAKIDEEEKPILEEVYKNSTPETTVNREVVNETELFRSKLSLDVKCDSNEGWKLAIVMNNFSYQMMSKTDKHFELKS